MSSYGSLFPSSYQVHWDLFDHTWFTGEENPYVLTVKETDEKPRRTSISVERYKPRPSSFSIPFISKMWGSPQGAEVDIREWSKAAQVVNHYLLEDEGNVFREIASHTSDLEDFEDYCDNFVHNCVMYNREYVGRLKDTVLKGIQTDDLIKGTDFDRNEKILDAFNKNRKMREKIYLISHRALLQQLDYVERNLHRLSELSCEEEKSTEA